MALRELCRQVAASLASDVGVQFEPSSRHLDFARLIKAARAAGRWEEDHTGLVLSANQVDLFCRHPGLSRRGTLHGWKVILRDKEGVESSALPLLEFAGVLDDGNLRNGLGAESDKALALLTHLGTQFLQLFAGQDSMPTLKAHGVRNVTARDALGCAVELLREDGVLVAEPTFVACGSLAPVAEAGYPLQAGRLQGNGEWVCQFTDGDTILRVSIAGVGRPRVVKSPVTLVMAGLPAVWLDSDRLAPPPVLERTLQWGLQLSMNRHSNKPEWKLSQRSSAKTALIIYDAISGDVLSQSSRGA